MGNHDVVYRDAIWYFMLTRLIQEEIPAKSVGEFTMFKPYRTPFDEEIRKDLSNVLRDAGVSNNVASAIIELIEQAIVEGTEGKARLPYRQKQPLLGDSINVIPSDIVGSCRDVLVAFCFNGDSFSKRLREVAYHAGIHCPETKVVILVTSQWNPREWERNHRKAFEDLKAVVVIYFVGFGRITRIA